MNYHKLKRKYWYPISVSIELRLRRIRIWIDRLYRKYWPVLLTGFIMLWLSIGFVQVLRDYFFIGNYAHFEALSSDYYNHWNTEGSPGQEPPKQ